LLESSDTKRYNWHPAVHTRFREKLYFFLIKFTKPHHGVSVAGQIRGVLEQAEIAHACEYAVYGEWDALVRVWLADPPQRRLERILRSPSSGVSAARFFTTQQIRHLWAKDTDDLLIVDSKLQEKIAERRDDIKTAVEGFDTMSTAVKARLDGADLLLERPPTTGPDPVKFYVCLKTGPDSKQEHEIDSILEAVEKAGLTGQTSLYSGVGTFADFMLRCSAERYSDVLSLTAAFDNCLRDLEVRPMHLLVADPKPRESDNVNDLDLLSPGDEENMDLLKLPHELLVGLPPAQREALNSLVEAAFQQSEGDDELRDKLRELLKASIEDDRRAFNSTIAFLLEFEWFLGEFLKRIWAVVYGRENWPALLAQEFESTPETAKYAATVRKPGPGWTLGTCVHMAIHSAELNDEVELQMAELLGPRWVAQMRTLVEVRNFVAHGQLRSIDHLDDFQGAWGAQLPQLMSAIALHFRCERLMSKEEMTVNV
jgi:hypothetical protein